MLRSPFMMASADQGLANTFDHSERIILRIALLERAHLIVMAVDSLGDEIADSILTGTEGDVSLAAFWGRPIFFATFGGFTSFDFITGLLVLAAIYRLL